MSQSQAPREAVVIGYGNPLRCDDGAGPAVVERFAGRDGIKVIVAYRGATALSIARERKVDAITLDINLPDMDGWRVLDRLKYDVSTRHVPVQEQELRAALVDVNGHIVLLGDGSAAAIVEEPYRMRRVCDAIGRHLPIGGSRVVDVLVQTVKEKV